MFHWKRQAGSNGSTRRRARPLSVILFGGAMLALALPAGGAGSSTATRVPGGYQFNVPSAAAVDGTDLYVTNEGGNSVTEVEAASGHDIGTLSGSTFGFSGPTAIIAIGPQLIVANGTGNSLTEFTAGTNSAVQQWGGHGYHFKHPFALAAKGEDLYVLSANGSVTEVNTATGEPLGVASGPAFGFSGPAGIAVDGHYVWVTNSTADTVTEIDAADMTFAGTISGAAYQFDQPTGIAAAGNKLWVTNAATDSATELSSTTGRLVRVVVSENLPTPGPVTYGDGYVFAASPPGSSPMVSQITPQTGTVNWMVCNTNGPYLFNNPQALAVAGSKLWVVNEGGNSLTEVDADSGALIRTVS